MRHSRAASQICKRLDDERVGTLCLRETEVQAISRERST